MRASEPERSPPRGHDEVSSWALRCTSAVHKKYLPSLAADAGDKMEEKIIIIIISCPRFLPSVERIVLKKSKSMHIFCERA